MTTPIHLIDLGPNVDRQVLAQCLESQAESELVRGILQMLRDTSVEAMFGSVAGIDGKDDRFIYASLGKGDGLESVLRALDAMRRPEPQKTESEALLDDNVVPTE